MTDTWEADIASTVVSLFVGSEDQAVFVGSAFLVEPVGTVVTARHVIDGMVKVKQKSYGVDARGFGVIQVAGGSFWTAEVGNVREYCSLVPDNDLAMAELNLSEELLAAYVLPMLAMSSEKPGVGTKVTAFGNTSSGRFLKIGDNGTITANMASITTPATITNVMDECPPLFAPCFEMDQPISGGQSGGPIVDEATGFAVGVCSFAPSGDSEVINHSLGTMTWNLYKNPPVQPEPGWLPI